MKNGGKADCDVADQNRRDFSQIFSAGIIDSSVHNNNKGFASFSAQLKKDGIQNAIQGESTWTVSTPSLAYSSSLQRMKESSETLFPTLRQLYSATGMFTKEQPVKESLEVEVPSQYKACISNGKAEVNHASVDRAPELIKTLFQFISLFLRHSFDDQKEFLFFELSIISKILSEVGSDDLMNRLVRILEAADLKLVKLLRYLFEKCIAQDFSIAFRKYFTFNEVREDMISHLESNVKATNRFGLLGALDLESLSLLALKMEHILKEGRKSYIYSSCQLTEEHKNNLRMLTANLKIQQYFVYIDIVQRREIQRKNVEWQNIQKARNSITDRSTKTKQQFDELLQIFLQPGRKKIRGQFITVTTAMTRAFEHSFFYIDLNCEKVQEWVTKKISWSKNRKNLSDQELDYVSELTVSQRKQTPYRIRESIAQWILSNRTYDSRWQVVKIEANEGTEQHYPQSADLRLPKASKGQPDMGISSNQNASKRSYPFSPMKEEDTSRKIRFKANGAQQTMNSADLPRVIRFSSINRMSNEFDTHYKLLRKEEGCLLMVVVKALEDYSNSTASQDFEALLQSNWEASLGWEEVKDLLSVKPEGLQDFFIREFGKKQTLEANRGILVALYNYLIGMVPNFRQKEFMKEFKRQHLEEEDSQQPLVENANTTELISKQRPNSKDIFSCFTLAVFCCAVATRPSIIPLSQKKFRAIILVRYQHFQLYCAMQTLTQLKDIVEQQQFLEVRLCLKQLLEIEREAMKQRKTRDRLARIADLIGRKKVFKDALRTTHVSGSMTMWLLKDSSVKGPIELFIAEIKRWHRDQLFARIESTKSQQNMITELKNGNTHPKAKNKFPNLS